MSKQLKDKVVIITGASSGIGKVSTEEFATAGAKVVFCARNIEKLGKIEKDLKNRGFEVAAIKTDVTNQDECKRLIEFTIEKYGQIDVSFNCC